MRGGSCRSDRLHADRLDDVHRGHHPGNHRVVARQELADSPVGDGQRLQFGDSVQHAPVVHLRAEHPDLVDDLVDAAEIAAAARRSRRGTPRAESRATACATPNVSRVSTSRHRSCAATVCPVGQGLQGQPTACRPPGRRARRPRGARPAVRRAFRCGWTAARTDFWPRRSARPDAGPARRWRSDRPCSTPSAPAEWSPRSPRGPRV